jgi:2-isopropylmalate synthase
MKKIIILDTSLRDGEQAPGNTLDWYEKRKIAEASANAGVDVIEAGFAMASEDEVRAIDDIAKNVREPIICSLARAKEIDIETAARALQHAEKPRIHTFIGTSPLHRDYKIRKSKEEIIDIATKAIRHARKFVDDVQFSLEDATRTETDYAIDITCAAIAAGASTINFPDTVGYALPHELEEFLKSIISGVKNRGHTAIFDFHGHNDLGLVTANSIAAIRAGCTQVEGTWLGIGERAGNLSLEQFVMALTARNIAETNIKTKNIGDVCDIVSKTMRHDIPRNQPIVGKNAFAHESGIHQDGVIKHRETYEIIDPKSVGISNELALGRHSGIGGYSFAARKLYEFGEEEVAKGYERFKQVAGKLVDDATIMQSITGQKEIHKWAEYDKYEWDSVKRTMIVTVKTPEGERQLIGKGNGPIDAGVDAINQLYEDKPTIEQFRPRNVSKGSDAVCETYFDLRKNGYKVQIRSEDTDTIASALKGYVEGANRMEYLCTEILRIRESRNNSNATGKNG